MFDFGFSEMVLIGIVALVVLGPERLPVVARTVGEWVGKAQRFVAQVKSDIDRETDLGELKKIQEEARALANDVRSSVQQAASSIEADVNAVKQQAQSAASEIEDSARSVAQDVSGATEVAQTGAGASDATPATADAAVGAGKSIETTTQEDIARIYGWGSVEEPEEPEPRYQWVEPKRFAKRYHSGPTVDQLAGDIERMRRELGMREVVAGQHRYGARSRTCKPRIYR